MSTRPDYILPIALAGPAYLAGMIASISIAAVPALAMAPMHILPKQWQFLYHKGRATMPPLAVCSAASLGFLAYTTQNVPGRSAVSPSALYAAAALLVPCIVPYTLIVMGPTLERMEARADSKPNAPSDAEFKALLSKWTGQNMIRAYIAGASAVLAGVATFIA